MLLIHFFTVQGNMLWWNRILPHIHVYLDFFFCMLMWRALQFSWEMAPHKQSSNVRRKRCTDTNTSEGKQTFNLSVCDHLCMPEVFSNINSYQPVELSVILGIVSLCSGLNFIFSFAHHRLWALRLLADHLLWLKYNCRE